MSARRLRFAWIVLHPLVLVGCTPCPESFVSQDALVAEYNANARRVPKLWARARIRATFTHKSGLKFSWGSASPLVPSNGYVMLWKEGGAPPGGESGPPKVNFVLIGREIGTELFRLGLDARAGLYYLWYDVGDERQAWFGRQKYAGAPGVIDIPIDPMQLVEILGVTELPDRPAAVPAVIMTRRRRPCSYVVQYLKFQPVSGHLKIWREVLFRWSDKQPRRPYRIRLFDADGRCRVVADVRRYGRIAWNGPEDQAPIIPTDIRMTWPKIKNVQPASSIHLTLSEMSTTRPFKKGVFDFWSSLSASMSDPIQVDAVYGPMRQERRSQ